MGSKAGTFEFVLRLLSLSVTALAGRHIRFICNGILHAFPGTLPVLILQALLIVLFAFSGSLMFSLYNPVFQNLPSNLSSVPPFCSPFYGQKTPELEGGCQDYFFSVESSVYGLATLSTKTSWPNIMLPYYAKTQWAGIYFVLFLLLDHFFIFRLLLASASADFKQYCSMSFVKQQRRNRAAFAAAFRLVSYGGYVSSDMWIALTQRVNKNMPSAVSKTLFRAVGGSSGYIGRPGFLAACTLMDVGWEQLVPRDNSGDGLFGRASCLWRVMPACCVIGLPVQADEA